MHFKQHEYDKCFIHFADRICPQFYYARILSTSQENILITVVENNAEPPF